MPETAKSYIRKVAIDRCKERLATREKFIAVLERYRHHINTVDFKFKPVSLAMSRAKEYAQGLLRDWVASVYSRAPLRRFDRDATVVNWQENPRHKITQLLNGIIKILREGNFIGIGHKIADCINQFARENVESGVDYYEFLEQIGFVALMAEFHFMETIELQSTLDIIVAAVRGSSMSTIDGLIEKHGSGEPAVL